MSCTSTGGNLRAGHFDLDDNLDVEIIDTIAQVSPRDWNRLVPSDSPYLRHEFLHALEHSRCVAPETGWLPQHIVIRNPTGRRRDIIAATPLYLKNHSWGEFIFDWDWAHAYQQHGLSYFPKLISQTPFTPATSPKLLVKDSKRAKSARTLLAKAAQEVAHRCDVSSTHWHFISEQDSEALESANFLSRKSTFEYIWTNPGYRTMEDFLATLSSRKRKKIRSERHSVRDREIAVDAVQGADLNESHWQLIDRFYRQTVAKYHSHQYLSMEFFDKVGKTMPESFVLFLARRNQTPIAGSLCMQGENVLYGRYWGSLGEFRNLHFEVCYYAAIEYCIQHGLYEYNAGVQGEHKLNRGFLPRLAKSSHSFDHPAFSQAIDRYIEREASQMQAYCQMLDRYSAYRKPKGVQAT